MKFLLKKVSDYTYEEEIELNSLEELVKFMEDQGYRLIIDHSYYEDGTYMITIFDGHL